MSGTIRSISQLAADITTRVYQNVIGAITGTNMQQQLLDLSVSAINRIDDENLLNLRTYVTTRQYKVGEHCVRNGNLYQCVTTTIGTFNPIAWLQLTSSVSLPIVTEAQRDAISTADNATAWIVFNSDSKSRESFNPSTLQWEQF